VSEYPGLRTGGSERKLDAACGLDDARAYLQKFFTQGYKFGDGERMGFGDCDAAKGVLTTPVPDDPLERGRFDGTALRSPTLVDEPVWPQLAFPISDQSLFGSGQITYPTPFLGPGRPRCVTSPNSSVNVGG
jgi:hypothetical protein